ncbi:patatin-like phospholipase family protein [Rhizobium sp. R693]|uniref:patatin-like phospholipase family protein n=1 Tax=Rhizobium sp. R693 TaxID=1764276 RepID=UPI000B535F83|nr:patatin-like phospholipase family protein [Rhizobium sp. R693]OWV99533.1 hypothetical protein ATY79_17415 [Rhizobium sp. R693]
MDNVPSRQRLGLALSGGGVRAAVFHLGVLRYLAQQGRLEDIAQISTVSGGSLIVGAIFSHAGMRWPSSEQYLNEIYPVLRARLTSGDLFSLSALGWKGIVRENLRILFRRAEILPKLLASGWGIQGSMKDLPDSPEWHINTTCYETGKNWRFSKKMMGDWQFGRHFSPDVPIANAIAASAAVPYAIGVLRLDLPEHGWWRTDPATKEPLQKVSPLMRRVRLWDGGAYENMGLEAIYKPKEGLQNCDFLICSDASGPLGRPKPFSFSGMLQGKLNSPRLFDIASDQIRALRSRMLMGSIARGEIRGILVRMGTSMRQFGMASEMFKARLTDEQGAMSLNYPTNLTRISEKDFDLLSRHGFEVCEATMTTYAAP